MSRVLVCSWFDWLTAHRDGSLPAVVRKTGNWSASTEAAQWIARDLEDVLYVFRPVRHHPDLYLTAGGARDIAVSQEYRSHLMHSPQALAQATAACNPNRRYGLSEILYGFPLRVIDPPTWDESLACFLRAAAAGPQIDLASLSAAADYLMEQDDPAGERVAELLAGPEPRTALVPAVMRLFDVDYAAELERPIAYPATTGVL
jgi:hypothetical protein